MRKRIRNSNNTIDIKNCDNTSYGIKRNEIIKTKTASEFRECFVLLHPLDLELINGKKDLALNVVKGDSKDDGSRVFDLLNSLTNHDTHDERDYLPDENIGDKDVNYLDSMSGKGTDIVGTFPQVSQKYILTQDNGRTSIVNNTYKLIAKSALSSRDDTRQHSGNLSMINLKRPRFECSLCPAIYKNKKKFLQHFLSHTAYDSQDGENSSPTPLFYEDQNDKPSPQMSPPANFVHLQDFRLISQDLEEKQKACGANISNNIASSGMPSKWITELNVSTQNSISELCEIYKAEVGKHVLDENIHLYKPATKYHNNDRLATRLAVSAPSSSTTPDFDSFLLSDQPCYSCPKCPTDNKLVFGSEKRLMKHLAKHTRPFVCEICLKRFARKDSLVNHLRLCAFIPNLTTLVQEGSDHPNEFHNSNNQPNIPTSNNTNNQPNIYTSNNTKDLSLSDELTNSGAKCAECDTIFHDVPTYRRHLRTHTHPHECKICGSRFARRSTLAEHSCDPVLFECSLCSSVDGFNQSKKSMFPTLPQLEEHLADPFFHALPPSHQCSDCGRKFRLEASLEEHVCHQHFSLVLKKVPQSLDSHADFLNTKTNASRCRITNLDPFICESCGRKFASSNTLKSHMAIHGERNFKCGVCGKSFHRRDTLKVHGRVHEETAYDLSQTNVGAIKKGYACPVCGKVVKSKNALDMHSKLHMASEERLHECGICARTFLQKGNLRKHLNTHARQRYSCPICRKVFSSKEYCAHHIREHTEEKRFACVTCGKRYLLRHRMLDHFARAHTPASFVCPFCEARIKMRHSLKRHFKRKHPNMSNVWDRPGYVDNLGYGVSSNIVLDTSNADMPRLSFPIGIGSHAIMNTTSSGVLAERILTCSSSSTYNNENHLRDTDGSIFPTNPLVLSSESTLSMNVDKHAHIKDIDANILRMPPFRSDVKIITEPNNDVGQINPESWLKSLMTNDEHSSGLVNYDATMESNISHTLGSPSICSVTSSLDFSNRFDPTSMMLLNSADKWDLNNVKNCIQQYTARQMPQSNELYGPSNSYSPTMIVNEQVESHKNVTALLAHNDINDQIFLTMNALESKYVLDSYDSPTSLESSKIIISPTHLPLNTCSEFPYPRIDMVNAIAKTQSFSNSVPSNNQKGINSSPNNDINILSGTGSGLNSIVCSSENDTFNLYNIEHNNLNDITTLSGSQLW
ncbi:uncharacterized protein LOC135931165 [Gordionus sp. m RMFG-2023]|uniref:uncharacterized protein LOC135931165 n=1 Tax=Gordionus sp. m RMFG-2023 TaxID=3053472 RepID=UPI0031FC8E23